MIMTRRASTRARLDRGELVDGLNTVYPDRNTCGAFHTQTQRWLPGHWKLLGMMAIDMVISVPSARDEADSLPAQPSLMSAVRMGSPSGRRHQDQGHALLSSRCQM